jgi:nucleoside-diphosphate-sugar epimerase
MILLTGAETDLGRAVVEGLHTSHPLRLAPANADLRDPAVAAPLVEGTRAVLHLTPFAAPDAAPGAAEAHLDAVTRGTYVLLQAAVTLGAARVVLASRLDLLTPYPENLVVDEGWKPLPEASPEGLAPFLAELTAREFLREEERLEALCLRFGPLNGAGSDATTAADAVSAIARALEADLSEHGYRWQVFHICSGGRFPTARAQAPPLRWTPADREQSSEGK